MRHTECPKIYKQPSYWVTMGKCQIISIECAVWMPSYNTLNMEEKKKITMTESLNLINQL